MFILFWPGVYVSVTINRKVTRFASRRAFGRRERGRFGSRTGSSPLYPSKVLFFESVNPICRAFYGKTGDTVDREKGALYYILRQTSVRRSPVTDYNGAPASRTHKPALLPRIARPQSKDTFRHLITFILSSELAKMLCTPRSWRKRDDFVPARFAGLSILFYFLLALYA